jgi:hypothetical protein
LLARRRQHQRPALAQEQLQVEAGLQLFQLVGEGGLGEVENERRARQGSLLGQRGDRLQVFDIDSRITGHCHA